MVVRPSPTRWNWTGTGCTHTYLKTGQREVNNTFGEIQHPLSKQGKFPKQLELVILIKNNLNHTKNTICGLD